MKLIIDDVQVNSFGLYFDYKTYYLNLELYGAKDEKVHDLNSVLWKFGNGQFLRVTIEVDEE